MSVSIIHPSLPFDNKSLVFKGAYPSKSGETCSESLKTTLIGCAGGKFLDNVL